MPAIARKGDVNIPHCSSHSMSEGSSKWFLDGRGIVREGDLTTTHLTPPNKPPCPPHTAGAAPPNRKWYCDGRLIAAFGDPIAGCTSIAEGSPKWFIGE